MIYETYSKRIDLAIDELKDIKARMLEAEVEFVIPRCNPIRVVNPAPGVCIPNISEVTAENLEAEITAWIQDAVGRILSPQPPLEPKSEPS